MNYKQSIEYLFSILPYYQRQGKQAYKANLDNIIALSEKLYNPHLSFPSIHIAGTNGKGSVSYMLSSILQEAGYKTGLYTSPHLKDFRERIKINGRRVKKDYVISFVNSHSEIFEKIQPSFFEVTVAMAFDYFRKKNIDIAIVETGLGGRLDSTNIITPVLSIITNIGKDHTYFLGDTLPKIAYEKAGIIKKNIPVIIGESNPLTDPVFISKAIETNSDLTFADKKLLLLKKQRDNPNYQEFDIYENDKLMYRNLKTDLLGEYQEKNIITVLCALDKMNFDIQKKHIYRGLKNVTANTGIQGRWQILKFNPLIICDSAHNRDGLKIVIEQVLKEKYENLHFVVGFVDDKDMDEILPLFPAEASYYFTKANIERAMAPEKIAELARNYSLYGQVFGTIKDAFKAAKDQAMKDDLIFIGGSSFVVAEVL
ncbi:bifunctional folylpolyglutamate synthase/dihydrofolate synthase [Bacteroidota bacterium]